MIIAQFLQKVFGQAFNLAAQGGDFIEGAIKRADIIPVAMIDDTRSYIFENFGQEGIYAAYIVLASLIVYVLSKVLNISFTVIKVFIIPSLATAFIASLLLPFNFFYILPITSSIFAVGLLMKT